MTKLANLSDFEGERAVLACIIVEPDTFDEVAELLEENDFTVPLHRAVWRAVAALRGRGAGVDLLTVRQELADAGKLALVERGGMDLSELCTSVPSVVLAEQYAERVAELAARRRMEEALRAAMVTISDRGIPTADAMDGVESLVFSAAGRRAERGGLVPASEGVRSVFEHIKAVSEGNAPPALSTGLLDLDKKLGGLRPGQLMVLAGRPGMGKSALALGMALRAASQGRGAVPFFSLEMPDDEVWRRAMSHESRVSGNAILTSTFTSDDHVRLSRGAGQVQGLPLYVDAPPVLSLPRLRSRCRRLMYREGALAAIVVDYLQLMSSGARNESREQEIATISRGLKSLAKELECPVIALAQLNRSLESRSDKRPILSDLRESGAIEQDADIIAFVYRDEVYKPETEDRGIAEIIVGKQRGGPTGTVRVLWNAGCTRFDSLDTHRGGYQ